LRIAFIQLWHAEQMGYSDNFMPPAIAALGHDVHLLTTNVLPYFDTPTYRATYEPHFGPGVVEPGVHEQGNGVTLHRLPHAYLRGLLRMKGLFGALWRLRPDVVQVNTLNTFPAYEAALYKPLLGYALFYEARAHRSVFAVANSRMLLRERLEWKLWKCGFGRYMSWVCRQCFPISTDCAEIATRYFGMHPAKVQVAPLGTDTALFHPPRTPAEQQARRDLRSRLGFTDDHVVCIYTGRISKDKGPLLLAHAVVRLVAEGLPFRGLFVGDGPPELVHRIRRTPGCVVQPFVPIRDLPPIYRAADIGVWPRQESTSQLDAAACGLPLILDEAVEVRERIDGNGLTYQGGDSDDLADKIIALRDPERRRQMGALGVRRMTALFDWRLLARERLGHYEAVMATRQRSASTRLAAAGPRPG
jgi:glycosyltransferase involved in cell wall biosynthesis